MDDEELTALCDEYAHQVADVLARVRAVVADGQTGHTVEHLLVEVSRVLHAGARLGAMERLVPPEPYEPDAGPEPELDELRQDLANLLGRHDTYVEVFDPYDTPVDLIELRISDDVFSMVSALAHGLQHARAGRRLEALWWWQFSYLNSWGGEAGAAVRAMQSLVARERLGGLEV